VLGRPCFRVEVLQAQGQALPSELTNWFLFAGLPTRLVRLRLTAGLGDPLSARAGQELASLPSPIFLFRLGAALNICAGSSACYLHHSQVQHS
jgi:hypothetical protein